MIYYKHKVGSMKPKLLILLGINGAGKTTLFEKIKNNYKDYDYINQDNIVTELGLDKTQKSSYIKSCRLARKRIILDMYKHKNMVIETTSFPKIIAKEAKNNGYEIITHFIWVGDIALSTNRIKNRIAVGGHGVEDGYLEISFKRQNEILNDAIQNSNKCLVFENKDKFSLLEMYDNGRRIINKPKADAIRDN